LLILWFGIGETSKIVLIFIACFFPIFISSEHGVGRVDRSLVRAGRLLGASERDILWKVIIPGALPEIFTGLRISLAISLLAIVAAELVAADKGLGFYILDSERTFHTVGVFVGIVTIAVIGFTLDLLVRKLWRRLMPWFGDV
ncbi:MAG: ABC transporter permease, partial [Betaproteobacteria bacterium]